MEQFTWPVQRGESGTEEATVRTAQFGDGYRQTSGDGLNNTRQTWPVTCVARVDTARDVVAFLRRHVGRSFAWRNPQGELGLYQCSAWSMRRQSTKFAVVTASFEQAFHP